jgi:hypothetical protein
MVSFFAEKNQISAEELKEIIKLIEKKWTHCSCISWK